MRQVKLSILSLRVVATVLCLLWLSGCLTRRSKPATPETEVSICLSSSRASDYHFILVGMEEAKIEFPTSGRVSVLIPAMEGDYMEVLGVPYIDNDPRNFEILRLIKGDDLIRTLSIAEIEELPFDQSQCRLLALPLPD